MTLRLHGEAGVRYRLQSSPDLVNWSTVRSDVTDAAGVFELHLTQAQGSERRYYRLAP